MNRIIFLNTIVSFIIILSTSAIFADTLINTGKDDVNINSKSIVRYENVSIENGDCLSQIATEYNTSDMTTEEFINYLKTFNNLKSDTIYYGNNILIPIYE